MIYQMLEGRLPFDDTRQPDLLPSKPAALNAAQWQVLQNGFALKSELRPASVLALLEEIGRAAGPSEEEVAQARARAEREDAERQEEQRARDARRRQEEVEAEQARLQQEAAARQLAAQVEQARAAERVQQEAAERRRQEALAVKRQADAQAAAIEQQRLDKLRKEQEARRRVEEEEARKARKEALREQLRVRREEDAAKARAEQEERERKLAQAKAEAAQRIEQERARKALAARAAAELKQLLPTAASPVADASGVLRDSFMDGSGKGPELVLIPTGRFEMGVPEHEKEVAIKAGSQQAWLDRESPLHWVGIATSFALGRYPVTVGEWRQFVRATGWESQSDTDWEFPGFVQSELHPVVGVTWHDTQLYLRWLSEATGQVYRLPSESEWEYACRAGTKTAFSMGDTISSEQANYDGNFVYNGGVRGPYVGGTSRVGSYPANPWGLFDMHGNVWEWVQDVVHDNYAGAPADGRAWEEGGDPGRRILRGGSWLYSPRYLRSALRNGYSAVFGNDIVGFRVARKLA